MKYLFIFAHPDDETILSYGTLKKYSINNDVYVACLCRLGRCNSNDQKKRQEVFIKNITDLGIKYKMYDYYGLELTMEKVKHCLDDLPIKQPDIIVTHSRYDLHFEHRLVAEEALVKFRPFTNVKKFITTVSPTYSWTNQQYGAFNPNMFVDISEYATEKYEALRRYSMEFKENGNDNRSVESIMNQNRQYGFQMNTKYCEAYQVLWSKE